MSFGCASLVGDLLAKVWLWVLVVSVSYRFWLREFGNGFLVACVRWGFDCKSLVMTFGCVSFGEWF